MSSAINGLNLQQAQLALSTRNLTQEQMNQVLVQAGLIASENQIQSELVQSALAQSGLSIEKQKAILTELDLMNATTGEILTTKACTKEELLNILATKGVTGANAEAIISTLDLAGANGTGAVSFKLLTASIWDNIKALLVWLATNPVGWCVLAAGAIFGAVKAFDAFTVSFDEAVDKTKTSKQELDKLTSEISELNDELKVTRDRIEELIEKANSGTISLLEEKELNNLREQNDELQREITLKEKLAAIDAKEVAENASQSITYKTDDNKWDDEYKATDRIDKLQKYVDSANFYQDKLSEINQQILDIEESATDNSYKEDSAYKDLIKHQEEYQKGLQKVEKQMSSTYKELTEEDDGLYYNGKVIKGYEDLAERLDTVYTAVELYFDEDSVKDTTEDYIETIKNKLVNSGLSEEISNVVTEGFSEEELESIVNSDSIDWSVCLGLNDATAVIENIKEQLASIDNFETGLSLPDAKKLINGFKEGDTEVIGLIEEYQLLQEVLSDTGNIQQETYEKLLSCSAKYSTAIRTENGRITLNTTKLKQVAKSRQLDTKETIRQTLALKKQEWIQWKNRIENYNGTLLENIENTYGDIDALQQQITQYELLVNSLDNATSAFERFKAAQQTNDQDMYDTAKDAFDILKEYSSKKDSENYGKYNRDEFQEAAMLLMDEDTYRKALNAKDLVEYQKVVDGFVKSISPLFDENNAKSASKLFDEVDKILESGDVPKADTDWAERLGISKEVFNALKQLANQYDYNNKEVFESFQMDKLGDYQEKLSNVEQEQEALNAITDKTSNAYLKQAQNLEQAQGKLDTFVDETVSSMTKAYDKYVIPGNASGQTFAEYVKAQFDFEDTDVDGSILAMIDKADSLKKRLDSISPTEAVQKQFSEYDQLQSLVSILSALGVQYGKTANTKADFEASMQKEETKSYSDILKERVEQYKELQKQMGEAQKELLKAEPNSEQFAAVSGQITELKSQMDALREPITIEINANIAELEASIQRVTEAKNQFAKSNSGLENTMFYSSQMNSYNAQIEKDTANKAELEKTLKVVTDLDSSEVDNYNPEDKELKVSTSLDSSTVDSYEPPNKEMKVTVKLNTDAVDNYNPSVSENSTGSNANGTFNAFATGTPSNVSIKKNEKALVNELGEEGLVRNGKLIPIKGGAQFLKLKRGDIIFNHKQMKQLKKNGYTAGRGKLISGAHADGTVHNAFNEGMGTKVNLPNFRDVSTNNKAIKAARQEEKKETKEKEKEEKEATEEIFDWIERKIKRLQAAFDKWLKQAETALTSGFITKYYKKAANAMSQLLTTQGKAYNRYMQEANAVGLDETYAKKVRAGEIDIQTIQDEELADKISKYQEYYDKAIDSTTSFMETAEKLYNLPLDKAATKIEKFSDAIDLLDKKLDNAIGSKSKNKLVDKQTKEEKKTLEAYKTASKEAAKNYKTAKKTLGKSSTLKNSGVNAKEKKAIKAAIKAGKEVDLSYFTEGSKGYNAAVKYNEALKARTKATYDLATAQEEYNSWLVEASKIKFDNIADDYEKKVQMLDHQVKAIDNRISEIETAGKNVNRSYYDTQKTINTQKLAEYKQEKADLEESLKNIKQGTDEWYDAFDAIQQVSSAISDCVKETYNLNNAINQLHFDLFNDISDSINRIITEQEFLQGLFAHEKNSDNETGNLTEAGIAKLGSLSASYYASKEKANNDKEMVDKLQSMLDNKQLSGFGLTFNSIDDLEAKLQEMYTTWQNDIKETYSLETSLVDVMKEKYQAELDLLKELIDRKKEALQKEKDLHDYQKQITEKTDNIATIQKQIAAYSGDTSQEGLAKLQKLQKELADKQEDLRETEYDRYISDQQDMLDKLYTEYEELITKKLEDFMRLVHEGLETANNNLSGINAYLSKVATDNGYTEETKGLFNGVTGGIKENADRIISVIEAKATVDSGTKSDGQGNAVADSAKPKSANTNQNGNTGNTEVKGSSTTVSDIDKANKAYDEHLRLQAEENKINAAKQSSDSESFELVVKSKTSTASFDRKEKTPAPVKSGSITEGIFNNLKKLVIPGFKKGGIVSVDDIEKQVKANGDDGLVSVKNGEWVVPANLTPELQKLTEYVPAMSNLAQGLVELPKLPELVPVRNMGNSDINIDFGGIIMNGVNDPKEFANQLVRSVQTVPKARNVIQSVSTDILAGGGRLGAQSIR